jgi:endoglucanase
MNLKCTSCILVLLTTILCSTSARSQAKQPAIRLNQVGFYPNAPKIAILPATSIPGKFYILSASAKDTVFSGTIGKATPSRNSSLVVSAADFSGLTTPGNYVVAAQGAIFSDPFSIGQNVMHEVAVAVLKGFYYQRVSMPLDPAYAGKWARPAGHPDTNVLIHPSAASASRPAGSIISTPRGWYDAGDYNKYIVNSGITMGTLLSAYEDFPAYFDSLKINIPESDNTVPDILDELLYNLRWMFTMQDPLDGGVYNKCTNAGFDGMVMPGVTKAPRYVVQKGTAAALDFAAVMAQASRVFRNFQVALPALADSCLTAATNAWRWAQQNPAMRYDQPAINQSFEPKITTGGYGDRRFGDELFWAATELYATTGSAEFIPLIQGGIKTVVTLPSWGNVHTLGLYTLARSSNFSQAIEAEISAARKQLLHFADLLMAGAEERAFKTVMGGTTADFNWGSNANAANQGIALINACLFTRSRKYIDAALSNLDYILGRNATGYCFVTGFGTKSPLHPHHRPSVADGIVEPVPGLLAGGANPGRQDSCSYAYSEPETAYVDADCSYASNEIAINWNAPLVYLANAIEALKYQVKYSTSGIQ